MADVPTIEVTLRDGRVVLLRRANPSDRADLFVIQGHSLEENIGNVGSRRDTVEELEDKLRSLSDADLWLVAEHKGRVIGSLKLKRPLPDYLHHQRSLGIELHREWRGAGLGSAMIRHAVQWARENGAEMILLGVLDSNPRARKLYERLGFRKIGHIPRYVKRPDGSTSGDTQMVLYLDEE